MFITLVRTVILYVIIMASMRIMGKRQLGDLQPAELVITVMISELAAIPLQESGVPLINTLIPIFILIALEIIISVINMKSAPFRRVSEGNPVMIIRDGVIDQRQLKRVRFTLDDLMEGLRQKNIFNIEDVSYAIVERSGLLSVLQKPEKRPADASVLSISLPDNGIPFMIISDGAVIEKSFNDCGMDMVKLKHALKPKKLKPDDVYLMTADKSGKYIIIPKERRA